MGSLKIRQWLITLILILWVCFGTKFSWCHLGYHHHDECPGHNPGPVQNNIGIDEELILVGLAQKTTLLSTFSWWSGPWCGQIPFFRPITSQLFWLEDTVFGRQRFHLWLWTALVSHLVAMALTFRVFEQIFQSKVVPVVTIALFAGPAVFLGIKMRDFVLINDHYYMTIPLWKNSPEYWASIAIFASCLAFMAKRYWLTLVCMVVAICTKESGFAILPALALIAWHRREWPPIKFWIAGGLITALIFAYRLMVLGTFGYRLGSNNQWWFRIMLYYGGVIGREVEFGEFHKLIAGIGSGLALLIVLASLKRKHHGELLMATAIVVASWSLAGYLGIGYFENLAGGSEQVTFSQSLLAMSYGNWSLLKIALLPTIMYILARYRLRDTLLIIGLTIVFSIGLYTAAQVTKHGWYLPDLFKTSLFSLAGLGFMEHIKRLRSEGVFIFT